MSFTGVENLDAGIDKVNVRLADIGAGFGTSDRRLAYRVLRGRPGRSTMAWRNWPISESTRNVMLVSSCWIVCRLPCAGSGRLG